MRRSYRIIAVTPAGRRRYLKLLVPHLVAQRPLIDECHLWMNCYAESNGGENWEDVEFCQRIREEHPDFIKLIPRQARVPHENRHTSMGLTIHKFFEQCTDADTIYVRFDDDIVWVAPDALAELLDYRIKHPNYFLVFANIVNNAVTSHIHQRIGALDMSRGMVGNACCDAVGWEDPLFAEHVHRQFLRAIRDGTTDAYRFREWILHAPEGPERFSINCFAFFGKKFAEFGGRVGPSEEHWLTMDYPREHNCLNAVCGSSLLSHFAFYPQRVHLDGTDVLEQYARLAPKPVELGLGTPRKIRAPSNIEHRASSIES